MGVTRPKIAGRIVTELPMPKRQVVEVECDRCHGKEYLDKDAETPAFKGVLKMPGEPALEVNYEVMCVKCGNAVSNYVGSVAKMKKEPDAKEEGATPPSTTQTPPPKPKPPSGYGSSSGSDRSGRSSGGAGRTQSS